ncbi:MAG: hypothetical protein QOJ25_2183 [Solirubrobacteraceae bacterium]|nr:hypothetical protein [Solirubrobacteraceae bacterium]
MTLRIGSGAAWWADRISPARRNAEEGDLDYLCFETMAEATVSVAQVRRVSDPNFPGYDTYLDDRYEAVLPGCLRRGTKIISNQGWVNPIGAAERIVEHLQKLGATGKKVAAITGNEITDRLFTLTDTILETGNPVSSLDPASLVSAEVYLGAEPIVDALRAGADVVVTGRVADPSLFLAPMIYEYGWALDDWARLGQGSGIGHLMECGAQVTGGYFADPGFKDVPRPWDLAFPIAEVESDGSAVLAKVAGSGGLITRDTVLEQLFYEVHDPANYLTPDVTVDFTTANIVEQAPDRMHISAIGGKQRSPTLKVSIGTREGYIGEDTFFYAGTGAVRRAELAREILMHRFDEIGLRAEAVQIDFLGVNAIHGSASPKDWPDPYEVGVRVVARTQTAAEAAKIGREVDGMAVSGVGMTAKRVPHADRTRAVVGVWSSLVDRADVGYDVTMLES